MSKTLVLFVYHIYNKRVHHFIKKCIFYDPSVDFVVISNNGFRPPFIPPYVNVLVRKNIGYDFGGWSQALLTETNGSPIYENYDNFIFVNSSVIGPFIRPGFAGKWTDIYLNGLQGNVKLFGTTINCCMDPTKKAHVQSYIFSMNKETLKYLIDCEIFSTTNYAKTFTNAVWQKEVLMSRKIIENGWNIGSLLPLYKDVDFTFKTKPVNEYNINWLDDVMELKDRNVLWNEYQLVFVKGNRLKINSTEDLRTLDKNKAILINRSMSDIRNSKNDILKLKMTEMSTRLNYIAVKPMNLFSIGR